MARHARRHEEAFEARLVEDGHPVGRDVEGAGPAARVTGLRHSRHRPARALEGHARLVEGRLGAEQLGIHGVLGLVVGERAGQGEATRLWAKIAPPRKIHVDHVVGTEAGIALHDEDGMPSDDDGQLDVGKPGHRRRPEPGGIDDDRARDLVPRGGDDARDLAARRPERDHLHPLLDDGAAPSRGLGVSRVDGGRVPVSRAGLVEDGAEPGGIDARLQAVEIGRIEDLRSHTETSLKGQSLLEGGAHGGADADEDAAAMEAGLASYRVVEALEDVERTKDHARGLRRRVELANDAHGAAGAARPHEAPLQDEDAAEAGAGQVKGERAAGDAATDDDGVGRSHAGSRSRTGSPCLIGPGWSTLA